MRTLLKKLKDRYIQGISVFTFIYAVLSVFAILGAAAGGDIVTSLFLLFMLVTNIILYILVVRNF